MDYAEHNHLILGRLLESKYVGDPGQAGALQVSDQVFQCIDESMTTWSLIARTTNCRAATCKPTLAFKDIQKER